MPGVITTLPTLQFSQNGEPVSGGSVTVYAANTVTPANTWQDKAQTTLNTNPIILDAQGRCNVWLTDGLVYDFVIKTALGATLYTIEDVSGASSGGSSGSTGSEWVVTGLTPTFISATSFSVIGNQTATYSVGRRVRATISSGAIVYGTIISSAFSSLTTVTLIMDSTSLDSGLSAVDVGIISYTNPSLNSSALLNLTGYAGADIPLAIGQTSFYDISAATSLLFRIATGDKQQYRLSFNPDWVTATSALTTPTTLSPNNTTLSNTQNHNFFANTVTGVVTANENLGGTLFNLAASAAHVRSINAIVHTATANKQCTSEFMTANLTARISGTIKNNSNDTSTAITSFGTMTFPVAHSGRVYLKREA